MGAKTGQQPRKKSKKSTQISKQDMRRLAAAVTSNNGAGIDSYPAWRTYLKQRREPKPLARVFKATDSPLLWGVATHQLERATCQLIKRADAVFKRDQTGLTADQLSPWCAHAAEATATPDLALAAVAVATALPKLAATLPAKTWQQTLRTLLQLATESADWTVGTSAWTAQLLAGELPLTLAYCLPELPQCRQLGPAAAESVSHGIEQLTDGSGMLAARQLEWARPLLASWLRCATMATGMRKIKLTKAALENIDWLVRHVLRLTRQDGSQALGPSGDYRDQLPELMRAAIRWSQDAGDQALAKLVVHHEEVSTSRLPEDPGYESEWAGVAVLQPDWAPTEPRLTVAFDGADVWVELACGKPLLLGQWQPALTVNGQSLQVVTQWDSICWYNDYDTDYLEIEADLSGGWKLQRQLLMARQDYFLYAADVLLSPARLTAPAKIEYRLDLPLAEGVKFRPQEETQDGYLGFGQRTSALVVPLGVPEWRCDTRPGSLEEVNGTLRLTHNVQGMRLYAPLFFDLHRRRHRQPATWRQLTVAENLQIVPPDVAVGLRVHVGLEQWLSYRSLAPVGSRTVLGQNLVSEFYLGRFLHDGDAETIVEIE